MADELGRRDGKLAPLALAQLASWESLAREWPVKAIRKETGTHLSCAICKMTLLPISDVFGNGYVFSGDNALAMTVAHLRRLHPNIEGNADGTEDA
jgi:hypothetical protein